MTRAIILAAGRGSRLERYTRDRPKCLTELAGVSLIDRQLATLRGAGISDIVVVTGYLGEMLEIPEIRRAHNSRWAETNMVESLFAAEHLFGDDLVVTYADIVYEPRVIAKLLTTPHDVAVTVDTEWRAYWEWRFADPLSDAESLRLDDQGRILEIGAPVDDIDRIQGQYMGLMRFQGAGVAALRAAHASLRRVQRPWMDLRDVDGAYMTDLLSEMILMGRDVHAVAVAGGWLEIDTADDYEKTVESFADGSIDRFFDPAATAVTTGS